MFLQANTKPVKYYHIFSFVVLVFSNNIIRIPLAITSQCG